jgi:hypothetical protein
MAGIPQVPSGCSQDAARFKAQAHRYKQAGEGAEVLERTPRKLSLRLAPAANLDSLEEAIAIERDCCPFYEIHFDRSSRELSFAISRADEESALEAIADAFGLSPARA